MEINQYYETLVQRDLNFYILPGGFTLLGETLIVKVYGTGEHWNKIVAGNLAESTILNIALFLAASYILGYVLYMVHNKTIGTSGRLKRHLILQGYIFPEKPSEVIIKMRTEMISAIFGEKFKDNIEELNSVGGLLQLYFNADKYIRQKSKDFYLTYIARLTATSRFCGVMSIACAVVGISLSIVFFYFQFPFIISTICGIAILFLLSFWFFKQSIIDQEELVWNVVQSIHLLQSHEKQQEKFKKPEESK